jgi:hypothetical protein
VREILAMQVLDQRKPQSLTVGRILLERFDRPQGRAAR